ncbi:DUF4157 domain-containing protein [Nostoc sp. TCL26-01]|nr:DUF4157 domain-containing protein [Nostoc sp. TCL26-01]
MQEVLAGKQTSWIPKFGGISQQIWGNSGQVAPIQTKLQNTAKERSPSSPQPNHTGLPDRLKTGIEYLSGYSMDDVRVHYNSHKPTQLQAHAYTQGTEIHVASGQEQHLPHEAWHVVQQKQGRVQSTRQLTDAVNVNDDLGLEKEADLMGTKTQQLQQNEISDQRTEISSPVQQNSSNNPVQRYIIGEDDSNIWATEIAAMVRSETDENIRDAVNRLHSISDTIIVSDYKELVEKIEHGKYDRELKKSFLESPDEAKYDLPSQTRIKSQKSEVPSKKKDSEKSDIPLKNTDWTKIPPHNKESRVIKIEQGLIHGDYTSDNNYCDLHVNESGQSGGGVLFGLDFLQVAEQVNDLLLQGEQDTGREGIIQLRPMGAAIVKIVTELLGESLGDKNTVEMARELSKQRKETEAESKKPKERQPFKLDRSLAPEHTTYLASLRGVREGLSISPMALNTMTETEAMGMDMTGMSPAEQILFNKYKSAVYDELTKVTPGLIIYIKQRHLPTIIQYIKEMIALKKKDVTTGEKLLFIVKNLRKFF